MSQASRGFRIPCFAVITAALVLSSAGHVHGRSDDPTSLATRIDALIARLGASNYLRRQRAAAELRHLGLRAFDQLLEASHSETPEIRLSARQLSAQLIFKWVRTDDPLIVKYALRDYQTMSVAERMLPLRSDSLPNGSAWLARLEDGVGTEAVCRIVRYDLSDVVAKLAAVRLMESFDADVASQREILSAAIDGTIRDSPRRPAQWLRTFQRSLAGQDETRAWESYVESELALNKSRTSRGIIASLMRQHVAHALRAGHRDQAAAMLSRLVDQLKESRFELLSACYWLIDEGHGEMLLAAAIEPLWQTLGDDPLFVYCQAEVIRPSDNARAEELADAAFKLSEENEKFAAAAEQLEIRYQASLYLDNRGHTDWAIREYERIASMKDLPQGFEGEKQSCLRSYAELLHDRQRDREAADVLERLVTREGSIPFRQDYRGEIVSRMHFFRAEQHREEADRVAQIEELRKGIQADPTDADVLIAMFRLPRADKSWRDFTYERIQYAVDVFTSDLRRLEGDGVVDNRADIATGSNQIAWLIANTTGDFHRAIEYSHTSLELRPQSGGSLDTLGRAYFAADDLDNAIKYQRRAVKLEPHSQQIRRQLYEFETARKRGKPQG